MKFCIRIYELFNYCVRNENGGGQYIIQHIDGRNLIQTKFDHDKKILMLRFENDQEFK